MPMPHPHIPHPETDAWLGETLVARGIVERNALEPALRKLEDLRAHGETIRLGDFLIQNGIVTPSQVQELLQAASRRLLHCPRCGAHYSVQNWTPDREVFCPNCSIRLVAPSSVQTLDAAGVASATRSNDVASATRSNDLADEDALSAAGRPFGRYRLLDELGRGGMGIVWKAWDSQLRRFVALKQVLAEGRGSSAPAEIERFAREAQAAARLRHPNIVTVYDVGVYDGQHFFTTEFIQGRSLDRVASDPIPLLQDLEWVKSVGEALQYAHDQGIVHRDVKPANILIDEKGRPFVMDFGLAKDVERAAESGLTLSGALLGTPRYMSPEQASGRTDILGPATDQFSLGVVLYELLTRRPPFEGESLRDLLNAITEHDPVPPSRLSTTVHRDVETICLKALEKDPAKRYPTIGAFAADLGRFLQGEPIEARPASPIDRLARRLRKKAALVIPISAAAVVALFFAVSALLSRGKEEEANLRANAAEVALHKAGQVQAVLGRWVLLSEPIAEIDTLHHTAKLTPEERRTSATRGWGEVQKFIDATPPDSTSRSAMLALAAWPKRLAEDEPEALRMLAEARAADPDLPYAALTEALIAISEYLAVLPLPLSIHGPVGYEFQPPPRETARLAAIRARIDRCLAEAESAKVWGEGLAKEFRGAVGALREMQQGRYGPAEKSFTSLLDAGGLTVFARDLRIARGRCRYQLGRFGDAVADFEAVVRLRPGQPGLHEDLGRCRRGEAAALDARGEDPTPLLRAAIEDARRAIQIAPTRWGAYEQLVDARCNLAEWKAGHGEDPTAEFSAAVAEAGVVIEREPGHATLRFTRALTLWSFGQWESRHDIDPGPRFRQALEDLEAAIAGEPEYSMAWNVRGLIHQNLGKRKAASEEDPTAEYASALTAYENALRIDPKYTFAYSNRAVARRRLGEWKVEHGVDPVPDFIAAIKDLDAALALCIDYVDAWHNRAVLHKRLGDLAAEKGADPRPEYDLSIRDYGEALKRNETSWESHANLGVVHYELARWLEPRATTDAERAIVRAHREEELRRYERAYEISKDPEMKSWRDGAREALGK